MEAPGLQPHLLAGLSLDPMNPEPLPYWTQKHPQRPVEYLAAGSRVSPDVLYLIEDPDTKETDIVEFNNEQKRSSQGRPERSRTWF